MALLFEEENYRVLGSCFEVYKEKGLLVNFGHYPKLEHERIVR